MTKNHPISSKRKKEMKEKRKKKQKLDLKMIIPGDQPDNPVDQDLFSLSRIRKNVSISQGSLLLGVISFRFQNMKAIETEAPEVTGSDSESDDESVFDGGKDVEEDESSNRYSMSYSAFWPMSVCQLTVVSTGTHWSSISTKMTMTLEKRKRNAESAPGFRR